VIGVETDIHKACGNISLQLNLKQISPEDLINKEIQNNTKLGEEFKAFGQKNERIPEEKIFDLISKEIQTVDKFANGILLENFPKTLRGAEFLKTNKIILDRIFQVSEETITEKFAQKKYTHELLDVKDIFELFQDFTVYIDAKGKPSEKVSEEIVTMLNYRVKHTIPLRPPRILIINPPGINFDKIGAQIAQKFGLVHIDGTTLLNKEVNNKSRIGGIISDCFKNNDLVPDDLLCGLVYNELTKSTTRVLGWVLTGFPFNTQQFHKFLSWELHPHIVLNYETKEESFTKNILEADVGILNYYDQVFVNKSKKNQKFLDNFLKESEKLKHEVQQSYLNKIENIEIDQNTSQIVSKVGKLLQNPVYYD